jgi:hypothetical protein
LKPSEALELRVLKMPTELKRLLSFFQTHCEACRSYQPDLGKQTYLALSLAGAASEVV